LRASHSKAEWIEDAKKRAALEAVKHVQNGYVIGLGSGTTASHAIREIGKIMLQRRWDILGVPTSNQAFLLAAEFNIPITSLDEHPRLDLTIDGVDQIDPDLNMIKGMGGALTREKIVASASKQNIIIADETKLVNKLGTNHPVPVEVLPFALGSITLKIKRFGMRPILRTGTGKVGPIVTDNGNFIIDLWGKPIDNPRQLDTKLRSIPGIVETGLFLGIADIVYAGTKTTVEKIQRK
jgi:ribose 5-phosphate isomerase A